MDIIKSSTNEIDTDAVMEELHNIMASYAERGIFLSLFFTANIEITNKNGNDYDFRAARGMVSVPAWVHGGGVGAFMGAMGEGPEYTDNPITLVARAAQHAAVHHEYIIGELNKVGEIGLIKLVDNSKLDVVKAD
ncbi:hypothetical protein PAER4900a_00028 [Pseudomonas phage YMC17/07/R4900a]|nr:hypothetical protein PAER4900a_00028 [Pseudomonas phage YMC17/07/R4900a]